MTVSKKIKLLYYVCMYVHIAFAPEKCGFIARSFLKVIFKFYICTVRPRLRLFLDKKNRLNRKLPPIRLYFFPKKPHYCEKYTLKIALNRKFWYSNQNRLISKIALTEAALNRGLTVNAKWPAKLHFLLKVILHIYIWAYMLWWGHNPTLQYRM